MRRVKPFVAVFVLGLATAACSSETGSDTTGTGGSSSGSGGGSSSTGTPPLPTSLAASVTSTRFETADHMLASAEMQFSGEPFAELLGRDIGGYDRFSATTDNYLDPETGKPTTDPLGFSLAVESYEYSKQPMNQTSFESGAGLSLQFGPLLNPSGVEGEPAFTALRERIQFLGAASRASGALFGKDFVTTSPPEAGNYYGWPGIWPVYAEFRSFDPAIKPSVGAEKECDLAGATDEPLPPGATQTFVGDYECDYNSLHLSNREAQVEKVLEPAALGYATWKQALWVINYWAAMHDVGQNPISVVPEDKLGLVGEPGNTVLGQFEDPTDPGTLIFGKEGTFLGGVSLEGFQGLVMLDEIDNKSELILKGLTSNDGKQLGGFASVKAALDYAYGGEIRFWPAAVDVTEKATAPSADTATKFFPKATAFAVKSGESRLKDLNGLLTGFGTTFAFTDTKNEELGKSQQFRATYDGKPWAGDNQLPDGEDSLHDRSLAILKVALVNLDRLHFDPANKVLVDSATVEGGAAKRGTHVSTFEAAYSIVALRTALRGLNGSLTLYSNDTPDAQNVPILLDQTKLEGKPFGGTLGARVVELIRAQADFLADKLLDGDGKAVNGFDLTAGAPDKEAARLEAQAAAIRGLLEAYLATSDNKYRDRAALAYAALEKDYWMDDVAAFRTTAGDDLKMVYTPRVFGALHGALRQHYKLVLSKPGEEKAAEALLARVARSMKLVANGWDDSNKDGAVQPEECLGGRLQMAERALTGEFSIAADGGDRDKDCVPDIASAGLPSSLAAEVTIERK